MKRFHVHLHVDELPAGIASCNDRVLIVTDP